MFNVSFWWLFFCGNARVAISKIMTATRFPWKTRASATEEPGIFLAIIN
jgi:hypothetical protein